MPPSLRPLLPIHHLLSRQTILHISPFLLPFVYTQHRAASILSSLSDNPGAYNRKIRRGRGPASGKGKTSGRGHKGQKQHGKVPRGFNGGQTKDKDTNPIRGLNNGTVFSFDMTPLNLDRLQTWITQGRIDPSRPITIKELGDSRCINPTSVGDGIKLLARGSENITTPLKIVVSRASAAAIAAIEGAGGSVTTRYYTPFSIKRILQGKTDPVNSLQSRPPDVHQFVPMPTFKVAEEKMGGEEPLEKKKVVWQNRLPDPVSRKAIEYYRDPAHRGYLSYQVAEGQGPSLFFKTPRAAGVYVQRKSSKSKKALGSENRIW